MTRSSDADSPSTMKQHPVGHTPSVGATISFIFPPLASLARAQPEGARYSHTELDEFRPDTFLAN